ncbi:MAG: hypothetical protein CMJ06_00640 [Pelagibacterales bacterium]|nr:hypothetical protein [Pelagibacterales bacterium]OUU63554.1 MAG: hypothetical protein CBC22_00610 [Alphaproteobacteria bacterium TMED62]|tara:strand:- start:3029 stop:4702 length:1674 start_codon:yes stop_codon:yes gene_type:complete
MGLQNKNITDKDKIYFLPLGGTGEIGMNFNMYCYKNEWLIVDCGVTFKDEAAIGSEVFMPNIEFITKHNLKISGMLITHAHEDHIGAVHHLWPYLKCPIYLTPFSAYLLKQRLIDQGLYDKVQINIVEKESKFSIGNFKIELFNISHSILEPNSVLIKMGDKKIFHTGDWKIDDNPNIGSYTDSKKFIDIGKRGIDAIVCDSTNANVKGFSGSENSIEKELSGHIKKSNNRIFITMFASNVERILTIINLAKKQGRKVGLIGRSMWRMTDAATKVGYLEENTNLISEKNLREVSDDKFLAICTGSQGEPLGALNRLASDNHAYINLKSSDKIIFSSRKIPGNEISINNLMNKLIYKGVEIITPVNNDIHVSGHPAQEELKLMYSWIKPKISIPVHGEAIHINAHSNIAIKSGVTKVLKIKNGFLVDITKEGRVIEEVDNGKVALNGYELIPVESIFFKERKRMLYNGVVNVNILITKTGDLLELPRIKFLAILNDVENGLLQNFSQFIEELLHPYIPINLAKENQIKSFLTKKIKKYLENNFNKRPSIILDIIYIEE